MTPTYDRQTQVRVNTVRVGPSWMDLIVSFLKDGTLSDAKAKAEKAHRKAPRYWLIEEHKLYKRSYLELFLLYVHLEAVETLLEELCEGICGSHTRGRSLSHIALTQRYW